MRSLAMLAIENAYGLHGPDSISKSHISFIQGFEKLLELEIQRKILLGEYIGGDVNVEFPEVVTILARRSEEIYVFEQMHIRYMGQITEGIQFQFTDVNDNVEFFFEINLKNKELKIDPFNGIGRNFNLETNEGIDREILFLKFRWCLFRNGHIEIWNEENDTLLGKSRAYILQNMMLQPEIFNAEIELLNNKKSKLTK